jgi:CheY-like chemotaxis protein
MNGVIGMSELILETDLSREQRMFSETICKSASALLTIINDILDFSKIESGKLELETTPFNLQTILEDIVALIAAKTDRNNVEVGLRYSPNLPEAFVGDSGRIRQIVTNVAGNAVKFTEKGYVFLNVKGNENGSLTDLEITIEDTGIGIPEENLQTIFNEFEQVDGAANRKFEGTGLGLAISSRLLKLMGGDISATSTVNQGSSFSLKLSLPTSTDTLTGDNTNTVSFENKNILVVDDLELNRKILSERLASWGVNVSLANSGKQALELIETRALDLIIMDYKMPEMDGETLAKSIRKTNPKLPIILLSSMDVTDYVTLKNELNLSDLLLKPTRSSILRQSIKNALEIKYADVSEPSGSSSVLVSLPPIHILAAEDNKTNQLVLKTMLKKTNVKLTIAGNGKLATELYLNQRPDLVLMDMSMPEMDGLQATTIIRDTEEQLGLPRCPIIALTANAMTGDREKCMAAGMDDYLSKPINKAALFEMISNWSKDLNVEDRVLA